MRRKINIFKLDQIITELQEPMMAHRSSNQKNNYLIRLIELKLSEKNDCVKEFYFNDLKRILSKPWNSNALQLKNNVMYPSTSNISKYIFPRFKRH